MASYNLYLVTCDRSRYSAGPKIGQTKPYHWEFFVETRVSSRKREGIAYQLSGMPVHFTYGGPEAVDLNKSSSVKHVVHIGQVPETSTTSLHGLFSGIAITNNESSDWNCQNWGLGACASLATSGFIYDGYTAEAIQNWVVEDL